MAHIEADRVKETTTTTGTGAIALAGAVLGFRTFASVMAVSDVCYYAIIGATTEWEVGLGTYSASTLTRTAVLASSNANAAVNFSAGTKEVFLTAPANRLTTLENSLALVLPGVPAEPPTPIAGNLALYAKLMSGRMIPKAKGPSGLDYPLQAALWQNNITLWTPTATSTGFWQGTVGAGAGTFTTALPTATNIYTSTRRSRWANVATTASQVLGQRNTELMYMRGSVAGQGGFFFYARAGTDVWTNGGRFFAGFAPSTTPATQDPSTVNNVIGFAVDAADAGAISFLTRGTAATKASTGFTLASNVGFDFYMFCAPNSNQVTWRIVNLNTGAEASGTATLNLPTGATMLTANVLASNAALTPVTSIQIGINRIYVETDY